MFAGILLSDLRLTAVLAMALLLASMLKWMKFGQKTRLAKLTSPLFTPEPENLSPISQQSQLPRTTASPHEIVDIE
jgi:hypothetical protein